MPPLQSACTKSGLVACNYCNWVNTLYCPQLSCQVHQACDELGVSHLHMLSYVLQCGGKHAHVLAHSGICAEYLYNDKG